MENLLCVSKTLIKNAVRLKNPNKTITFEDGVRGEISFDTTELGDFVIARAIDDPLYHFTVVVDDSLMEVTHVIRGEDHISNTPRQILIQEAIGAKRPEYIHLPLILAPDKSKLSKRHGAVMLKEYEEQGFLAHAIVNYLALLGWNPGTDKELFTTEELVEAFDVSGIQKGGAVFDVEKLKWFNKEHLQDFSDEEMTSYLLSGLEEIFKNEDQYSKDRFKRLQPTLVERTHTLSEVVEEAKKGEYDFAFSRPDVAEKMLKWKNDKSSKDALPRLQKIAEIVAALPEEITVDEAKNAIWDYATEIGKGEVLWPLRVALTGKQRSPDPFTIIHIIGPSETYKRINAACDTILSDG
jgi:glutamyl-tRNA synthetase